MKLITKLFIYSWLLINAGIGVIPASAQSQAPLTKRESDNITYLAKERLKLLNDILNQLTDKDLEENGRNFLISNSYLPNSDNQVFYNDLVNIEDDIDPSHTSADSTDDVPVDTYLTKLYLYYAKPLEPNTIVFSQPRFFPVQQKGNLVYIKGVFTSVFKGEHKTIKRPYLPTSRVVEMRADKVNNKWEVRIVRLGFVRPGEGMERLSQTGSLSSTVGQGGANNTGRPTIPDNLSINGDEVNFRQRDNGILVTLKFNKNWLQVVQSGSTDVPIGFYQRQGNLYVFDKFNTIEFQQNNSRFVFHKGLEYKGFERVLPERNRVAKPDPTAKPPANTTISEPAGRPDTTTRVAASLATPQNGIEVPIASQPTTIDSRRVDSTRSVTMTLPTKLPASEKQEKPLVSAAKLPAPDLTKSLSAEAKQRKARYRTMGWLQIVAGVAGLAGSYMTYSSIKSDHNGYTAQVDKLNLEYNAWRDIARQPSGSTLVPMAITSFGKPGIYGAYAGGGISLGLLLNGVRTLMKAGKIKDRLSK